MNYREELESRKSESLLQTLFKAARLGNEWALDRMNQDREKASRSSGRDQVELITRASHMTLIPHVDLAGTRITTLAERVGISKQAVSELVDDLEEMGTLERVPDPSDGRAKLVRFTTAGREHIMQGLALLGRLEDEVFAAIGPERAEPFRRTLEDMLGYFLEREKERDCSASSNSPESKL